LTNEKTLALNLKKREVKAAEDTLKATTANLAQVEDLASALKDNVERLDLEISLKTMVNSNIIYLIYFDNNFNATTIRRRTELIHSRVPTLRQWR
jgi:hypothetical protein